MDPPKDFYELESKKAEKNHLKPPTLGPDARCSVLQVYLRLIPSRYTSQCNCRVLQHPRLQGMSCDRTTTPSTNQVGSWCSPDRSADRLKDLCPATSDISAAHLWGAPRITLWMHHEILRIKIERGLEEPTITAGIGSFRSPFRSSDRRKG